MSKEEMEKRVEELQSTVSMLSLSVPTRCTCST